MAVGDTVGLFADGHTFWAVFRLTSFIGALDFTFRFLAFHIANCVSGFLATGVASGRSFKIINILYLVLADGVTNCGAFRVIAFPGALRVAVWFR